jgi:AraC-like DNA-binding protein
MESAQGKQTTWLRRILLLYIAYAVLAIGVSVIDYLFFDYAFRPRYIYATYGGLAILTYWVALQGFAHRLDPALHRPRPMDVSVSRDYEATLQALEAAMNDAALYRDGNLSLSSLSQVVGVKPYVVTHILNNVLNISFSDYVNSHRVADVTRRLADPEYANYTLLAIANDAGFNSKASFNRVVKKLTGRSPSQLRTDIVSQARRFDGSTTQSE